MKTLIILSIPEFYNVQIIDRAVIFGDLLSEEDAFNMEYHNPQILEGVSLELLKETIDFNLKNNRNVIIDSITYYESEKKLIIDSEKQLNLKLVENKEEKNNFKRVSSFLQEVTFVESHDIKNIEDYINLEELLGLLTEYIFQLSEIKNQEKEFAKLLKAKNVKFDSFEFDYEDYLFNAFDRISAVIKIEEQEDYRYLVNKDMLSNHLDSPQLIGIFCREIYKVFEILDNIKTFMNFTEPCNIKTNRVGTSLKFNNKEFIYGNEDFYLKFDLLNHQLTYFSTSYKDFKYLQKESADVLENTYIEIKDCPFFIKQQVKKTKQKTLI